MKHLTFNTEKYALNNGLEVILYPQRNMPLVSVNIWYRTGSANEQSGWNPLNKKKTGLAHLFEHMMFQGSLNVPKEMHFKYIQEAGGTLNGSTNFDKTNYYEKLPSNALELALWLESDRMGFLLPALTKEKLSNQIGVVKNERLERYENQPYGLAWEKLLSLVFGEAHPYGNSTIGNMEDILSFTIEDVTNFFNAFYQPMNASLVVAGDIEISETKKLIEKHFDGIENKSQIPLLDFVDSTIKENAFYSYEDNVSLERIYLAWKTDKNFSPDDAVLDILADLLTGTKGGRLIKTLVFEKQIAIDVSAFHFSGKYGGFFVISSTTKQGGSIDEIKSVILDELNKVIKNGIEGEELQTSKARINSSFIYSLQNLDILANQFNHYNYYIGSPDSFAFDLNRYENVEPFHIKSSAGKFLLGNYAELRVIPKQRGNNNG
jgi:zinc protease